MMCYLNFLMNDEVKIVAYLLAQFKYMFVYLWNILTSKVCINKPHSLLELKEIIERKYPLVIDVIFPICQVNFFFFSKV